jgi:hypothetical protein
MPQSLVGKKTGEAFQQQRKILEASFSMPSVLYQKKVDD